MPPGVEPGEVQGNVLHAYGGDFPSAHFVRLRVARSADARAAGAVVARWLGALSFGRRPTGLPERERLAPHVNLAVTASGLAALGVPPGLLQAFPDDFREGAKARAAGLGDRWPDEQPSFVEADLLLSVHAGDHHAAECRMRALLEENAAAGRPLEVVQERPAGGDEGAREPFGFADGGSQPAVEGVDLDPVGDGVYAARIGTGGHLRRRAEDLGIVEPQRGWRLLRAGEFLLGHPGEDGAAPPGPPAPLGPDGTFMVYRELDQDVDGFRAYVAEQARRVGMHAGTLEEKIVGRRRDDGTTLVRPAEDFPPPAPAPDANGRNGRRRRSNDFLYAGDPHGYRCPVGAHVRRTNPRDALPGGGERTMRHRIIRRGMRYKPPENGLVFICLSASIANGFEFIQRNWINDGTALGLGSDPDFLLQQAEDGRPRGHMVIPGYRPVVLPPPERPFVTVRGCEYLFVPSRRASAWLAGLQATS